jgi:hypothetical protein
MDDRLALEAELAALTAGLREALLVLEIEMDAIEDRDAGGAGGEQADLERGQHWKPRRRMMRVQVLGQVRGAHDQALDPFRVGDLLYPEDAAGRLDHAPDREIGRRAGEVEHVERAAHRVRTLDLGQQDGVGAGLGHGDEVRVAPGGVEAIDTRDELAPAIGRALLQGGDDLLTPCTLGIRGDGILEIEDQAVGRQAAALLERPGVGSRHVEQAAARAHDRWHGRVSGVAAPQPSAAGDGRKRLVTP